MFHDGRISLSRARAAYAPLIRENIAHISAEMSANHHNGQFGVGASDFHLSLRGGEFLLARGWL